MKLQYLFLSLLITLSTHVCAQKTVRMNAVKANDYGVAYSLPKTSFVITFTIKETTYERGEFYQYAQRYLAVEEPITEDKTEYTIEHIAVRNKGVPQNDDTFLVEFKSNTFEPYVFLTKDGLICSINAAPELEHTKSENIKEEETTNVALNPRQLFTEETLIAGSSAKQAELVAKQIFALRQSRNDILLGEADKMPPDGEAYKVVMNQIDEQEQALTQMFAGKKRSRIYTRTVTLIPEETDIDKRVIARFSAKRGMVEADDLSGAPIYLSLINKNPTEKPELSEKELRRLEKKFSEGIVYNIPSKAQLTVQFKQKTVVNQEVDVVQYGTQDVLTRKMFDNMKKPISVIFYPELGAIKQIIQQP